eukprot:Sspe_Gene.98837::Locus_72235_Transcript_1_1_Confidence_1.000_Length_1800::g.98837::m.98837
MRELRREVASLQGQLDAKNGPPPPDSSYGYVIVFCAFISQFTVLGAINSFGIFMDKMKSDESIGSPSNSQASLVVSLANGLTPFVGLFAGRLTDRWGPRPLLLTAAITLAAGLVSASYASSYPSLVVAFGLLLGLSSGCTISPGLTAIGMWFQAKRDLAFGLVYAGSGAGTTLVPLLANKLMHWEDGHWRVPFRWLALLAIPTLLAGILAKRRVPYKPPEPNSSTHLKLSQILTDRKVMVLFVVGLLFAYGFFSTVLYMVSYADAMGSKKPYDHHDKISYNAQSSLLSIFGAAQTVGNIVWGDWSYRFGNLKTFCVAHVACALLMVGWAFCYTYALLATFAGLMGFFVAGCISCYPAVAADHFHGPQLGSIISIIYLGFGIGGLIGPPITGQLVDLYDGSYLVAFVVAGTLFLLAMVLVALLLPPVEDEGAGEAEAAEDDGTSVGGAAEKAWLVHSGHHHHHHHDPWDHHFHFGLPGVFARSCPQLDTNDLLRATPESSPLPSPHAQTALPPAHTGLP